MEIRAYRGLVNPRGRYITIIIKGRRSLNSGEMEVSKYLPPSKSTLRDLRLC